MLVVEKGGVRRQGVQVYPVYLREASLILRVLAGLLAAEQQFDKPVYGDKDLFIFQELTSFSKVKFFS